MSDHLDLAAERQARIVVEDELATAQMELTQLRRRLKIIEERPRPPGDLELDNRLWSWLDTLSDGFAVFDSSHRLVAANTAYLRVLDLANSVGLGSSYAEIVEALVRDQVLDTEGEDPDRWLDRNLARWQQDRFPDVTIRMQTGNYIKVMDRRTEHGDIVSLTVNVTNLMQMWAGVEAIPDGFVIYDRDDRFVLCNQRYRDIYRASASIMEPGRSFREILRYGLDQGQYADAVGREDEWLEERLSEHRGANSIVEQPLSDGRWLRILEKATPDGGRVGLRVDISDQKAQQRALEDARQQAESASRAKSSFLANMSHELRTPMNGVVGMADILCETELTDEQRLYAETIRNSGESLLALLNDVLDFSKIEADKLSLRPEPFDLEHTIHEVVMLLRGSAIRKGLELYIDYDLFHPTVFEGDKGRIRQILTNLVGNAVKFTESGHVLVRVVGFEADTSGHQQIHITVEDTGIGIAPEMQEHIFGEFNQVEDHETRQYHGTGLGLAISKRLVEMMGGELWLDSVKDKGACFGIRLVLPISKPHQPKPVFANLTGAKLFVIDDQKVNRTILERQLTPAGATVTCCESGAQALELLGNGASVDLVITDNLMPEMGGLELANRLRSDFPELPILMLTSDPAVMGDPRAKLDIDKVLQKPTLRANLLDTISSLLSTNERVAKKPNSDPYFTSERRMRILAAEDNRTNRLVFGKLLKGLNVDLHFAENGQEAVESFQKDRPDLIFMDVSMPEMDGKTATRIIREMEQTANSQPVPVIALTAHALPGDDVAMLAAGMNAYLTKPLRKAEIIKAIHDHSRDDHAPVDKVATS